MIHSIFQHWISNKRYANINQYWDAQLLLGPRCRRNRYHRSGLCWRNVSLSLQYSNSYTSQAGMHVRNLNLTQRSILRMCDCFETYYESRLTRTTSCTHRVRYTLTIWHFSADSIRSKKTDRQIELSAGSENVTQHWVNYCWTSSRAVLRNGLKNVCCSVFTGSGDCFLRLREMVLWLLGSQESAWTRAELLCWKYWAHTNIQRASGNNAWKLVQVSTSAFLLLLWMDLNPYWFCVENSTRCRISATTSYWRQASSCVMQSSLKRWWSRILHRFKLTTTT